MTLKSSKFNVRTMKVKPFLGALALSLCFSSCESIFDDQSDCKTGISLAFIYDYHMEPGANSFPANVDCVDVLVFDANHNYLTKYVETGDVLQDESYRMELPLDPGSYHLVVYGGLACNNPTFTMTPDFNLVGRDQAKKSDIQVTLPLDADGESKINLHDVVARTGGCFYGAIDINIDPDDRATTYKEYTVNMMKNTNNIQIILQELSSPYTIDYNDYNFYITDDNFLLNGDNNPVSSRSRSGNLPQYRPYNAENRIMGIVSTTTGQAVEDEEQPVQVGCVEFSTSRLHMDNIQNARLLVTSAKEKDLAGNDKTIIDIPLITYLTAIRGMGDNWIKTDQEFLDRQSRWNMMFFLQKNVWVSTRVVVNNWVVRVNQQGF